ncbi:VanW family protein [Phototrophicus methaneseepsis]|uniref:VanW family protein n=1 Tax=Phototrophicus methaneseepsis TaxID=2710758 RepID=A0A7S8EBD8_9CHLR|nr:VanW family protein [Phototrophicus methaneseepsis]QPC83814.1 VanW family protein [Phototrophicus methaneseepsis]
MTTAPQSTMPPPYMETESDGLGAWLIRVPLLMFGGGLLLALLIFASVMAYQSYHSDRIYPGVRVGAVTVGGLSPSEAQAALDAAFPYAEETVFTFRDGERAWQMSAADLGVALDAEATVSQAFAIGHHQNPVNDLAQAANAWFNGVSISPIIIYDQSVAQAKLAAISAEIDQGVQMPSLAINGTEVLVNEGQTGRVMDVPATLANLEAYLTSLQTGAEIDLVIREAAVDAAHLQEAAEKIRIALSGPVILTATDEAGNALGPWTASVEQIASLLHVEQVIEADGTSSYVVDIDMNAFESSVGSLAPGLIAAPHDGRFHFDPVSRQLEVIQRSTSGRELNVAQTLTRLQEAVFDADYRVVPVAFDYTLPRFHNQITAAELGITELVSESTSYFMGSSQNRRTNIAVAASRLDGVVIAPGEEFSFNALVGEIAEENSFVEGKVIFGGRTTSGVGGGVCQVSTTVFRAAFTGGFAITERNSHGYRVGYYELNGQPPGLDAAIWQPERDFKFQNNTPYHILIETSIFPDQDALQFRFYSTPYFRVEVDDAIVKNIEPAKPTLYEANNDLQPGQAVQVDYAAEGADVTVYRRVYTLDGELMMDDYAYTHYLPWAAIYEVAPGDSRLNSS